IRGARGGGGRARALGGALGLAQLVEREAARGAAQRPEPVGEREVDHPTEPLRECAQGSAVWPRTMHGRTAILGLRSPPARCARAPRRAWAAAPAAAAEPPL